MSIRKLAIVALMMTPVVAQAQTAPTTVEVVSTGAIDATPSWFNIQVSLSAHGEDKADAQRAIEAKRQALRAAMKTLGIPADALTFTPDSETIIDMASVDVVVEMEEPAEPSSKKKKSKDDPEELTKASADASDTATLRVASLDQAQALSEAVASEAITLGKPTAVLADPAAARRQAKAKALAVAREDAAVYGRELGLRPGKVLRISEGGSQLLFPGMQQKFMEMFTAGPQAFQAMFGKVNPAVVHIEETIVVEFAMVP